MRIEKRNITITWLDLTVEATYDSYKSEHGNYWEFSNVEIVGIYSEVGQLNLDRETLNSVYKELDRQIEKGV